MQPRVSGFCVSASAPAAVRAVALGLALATGLASAPAARAEAPAAAPNVLADARRHFELGLAAFSARDYRTAIREFEQSAELAPSAELWFDIGRAHEELGELEQAKIAYERYLRDRVDAKDEAEVRTRIEHLRGALEQAQHASHDQIEVGSLKLHVGPDGSLILLDGRLLGRAPLAEPLSLREGRYRLDVVAPGRVPFRSEVEINPGVLTSAYAQPPPLAAEPPRVEQSRLWTWVALGLAGGSAIGFGVATTAELANDRAGDRRSADRWGHAADVALGGTVLCAFATVLLYFVEGEAPTRSGDAAPGAAGALAFDHESTVELDPAARVLR